MIEASRIIGTTIAIAMVASFERTFGGLISKGNAVTPMLFSNMYIPFAVKSRDGNLKVIFS